MDTERFENDRIAELSNKLNGHFLSDSPQPPRSMVESVHIDAARKSPAATENGSIFRVEASLDSKSSLLRSDVPSLVNGFESKAPLSPYPQQEQSSPNTYFTYEQPMSSPNYTGATRKTDEDGAVENNVLSTHQKKDVVWLLNVLRPDSDAFREEKKLAISELKKWTKTAPDNFWRLNSAQIVSVLLEAFNPKVFSKSKASSHLTPQTLTGLSPTSGPGSGEGQDLFMMEAMHLACKGLLVLVKVDNGRHMEVKCFEHDLLLQLLMLMSMSILILILLHTIFCIITYLM